jgi:hypothetical protein
VPIIAIPLASWRRRRVCRGSDKRSSRMETPHHGSIFLILKNRKPIHRQMQKFSESEMRIFMTRREIDANNWFYSKGWVGG